jgi:hypothetical protein
MRITRLKVVKASSGKRLEDIFDARNGYGQIPNSADIHYFGFTIYMRPSEFLALADTHPNKDITFYEMMLAKKEPLGYLVLNVKKDVFRSQDVWHVISHEGRHRCEAIQKLYGDNVQLPIHILPQYMRNRSLTPELLAQSIVGQSASAMAKKLWTVDPSNVDKDSSHCNIGKYELSQKYPHPAEAAVWQSEMMVKHSPADLKKERRNDDDVTEVLQDAEQPMNVYHNASPAPKGTSLPRRCN